MSTKKLGKKLGKTSPFLKQYFPIIARRTASTPSEQKKSVINFNRYGEQGRGEHNRMARKTIKFLQTSTLGKKFT